jgi:hypothetical protein
VNDFFEKLGRRLSDAASERGAAIDPPALDRAIADELLQLARVVAHGKERSFAPLATFLAGIATERFRMANPTAGTTDAAGIAAFVRDVREALEREMPASDGR